MRSFSLSLLGLLTLVLPSCRTALVNVDVSSRVESVLRGGEASCDVWVNQEWHLTKNELVEVAYANGERQYFIPVSMSPRRYLREVVSYQARNSHILRYTPTISSDRVLKPKKLYVPLFSHQDAILGSLSELRATVRILPQPSATHKQVLAALGVQGAASPQAPMRSYEQSEFPASDMRVLRRIPIAQMQQKLAKLEFEPSAHFYYTRPSLPVRLAEGTVHVLVDLPLTATGTLVCSFYENFFRWYLALP